jgi:hypothetical protein
MVPIIFQPFFFPWTQPPSRHPYFPPIPLASSCHPDCSGIYHLSSFFQWTHSPSQGTPTAQMATTRNQELINLQNESKQHKESIQQMTSDIASANSKFENLTDQVRVNLTKSRENLTSSMVDLMTSNPHSPKC